MWWYILTIVPAWLILSWFVALALGRFIEAGRGDE